VNHARGNVAAVEHVAKVAELFAHPVRAAILEALLDGRAVSASTLATRAHASRSGTSAHLRRLERDELIACEPEGRLRLYRVTRTEVAEAFEALARLRAPAPVIGLHAVTARDQLRRARSCYDHLAGRLGVELTAALVARGWLADGDDAFDVGDDGAWSSLGIDVAALRLHRRPLARRCMDWTEHQPHLAGALGQHVLDQLLEREWVARLGGTRALLVTPLGRAELAARFALTVE
jgi:DNA-binding transcriptional ArsR family regulator